MVKLHITFPEPQGNVVGEYLWATPLTPGKFRLENHPLTDDLYYRDIVSAEMVDDILEFQAFIMRDLSLHS